MLILILLAVETALGRWESLLVDGELDVFARVSEGVLRDIRIAIVHCLQVGYLSAAFLFVMRNTRQTVFELKDAMGCSSEECETLAASVKLRTVWVVACAVLGFLMSIVVPYLVPPVPVNPWSPASWSPEVAWHRILGPVAAVGSWLLGYAVISVSLRMSLVAKKLQHIDLLDLSPLAPFTQLGLRNSLVLIGSLSIWSLMLYETGFSQMMFYVGGGALISAAVALVLPVRGVHRRIQQSKEVELRWLNGEIYRLRDTFQNRDATKSKGGMADVIAYRRLIESVPEWPFTTSTYARLFLYLLLPLLTWGIGIFAEEIVARAFF
jgi:hypothetical protein